MTIGILTEYPYIQKKTEEKIKQFKYKGGSNSITYEHIWSPLCQYLVEKLPTTIAPNLITMTAFSFALFTHILMVYHSPDFKQEVPSYVLVLTGLSTISYQILDNMDGKQARRTNSSTPLGMLFDHGLDSVTTWIFGVNQIICFGAGTSALNTYSLLIACYVGFYSAQWSQYHIGYLKLGNVNAVDEGLIVVWQLLFFTSYFGVSFWQQELFGYRLNQIGTLILLIIGVFENLQYIYNTLTFKNGKSVLQKLKSHEQTLLLIITWSVVVWLSPSNTLNSEYGYLFYVQFGFLWSKSTLHLQVAHLGDIEDYNQWRISFVTVCLAHCVNTFSGLVFGSCLVDEKIMIVLGLLYSSFIYIHTSTNIAMQLSKLLGIQIFSLEYQKQK